MLTRTPVIASAAASSSVVKLWDTDSSNQLTLAWNENDTVDRTLNFLVNAADRSINLSGNLTLANNFTTSGNYALTFTLTGTTSLTLPTSGTLVTTADNLSVFAATTSAQLLGVISDETGSGALVFANTPTLTTPTIAQINGSVASGGNLTLQSTTHATKGSILFGTSAYDEVNNRLGIATATPGSALDVKGTLRLSGATSGYVGLAPAAAAGSTTYTLPSADGTNGQVLTTNGTGTLSWTSGGSGANTALSNLVAVAVNTSLISDTDSTDDLGSSSIYWANTYTDQLYTTGNVGIGTTTLGTNAVGVLGIKNGTAPASSPADMVQLYSADFAAGDARLYVRNEGGTVTFPQSGTLTTTSNKLSDFAATTSLELLGVISDETGSGALVFANTPTLVTPILGTPTSGTLTNCTGLPVAGITSSTSTALGVGSLELGHATDTTISRVSAGVIAVEGVNVLLNGGALGTPSSGTLTNCTGLPVAGITASTSTALGVGSLELGHASDTTLSRSAAGILAVEGVVIPSVSSTDTFTNKRITRRITTITSNATPTVNTDNTDCVTITALAVAITSMTTNLSGTPNNFDTLIYRIKDDGTARAITWGASFASRGATLPTTTTANKVTHVGFFWNSVTSTWDCVATVTEA